MEADSDGVQSGEASEVLKGQTMAYGKELILDLYGCDCSTFSRDSIGRYFEKLCDMIGMEREDLHWWDYEGEPEAYADAPDHLKGITAVQFIRTSNIVIHTLDAMGVIYLNIFSCKDFDDDVVQEFTTDWFGGDVRSCTTVPRLKSDKVEILEMKGHSFLWINDYLWMWDIAAERKAQRSLAADAYGDVLVAGYGLGLVQRYLQKNHAVRSFITIELRESVMDANRRAGRDIVGAVMIGDFFKFDRQKYDCVIGDVCDDILPEYLPDYKRFKAHANKLLRKGGQVLQWGGDFFEYLMEKEASQ